MSPTTRTPQRTLPAPSTPFSTSAGRPSTPGATAPAAPSRTGWTVLAIVVGLLLVIGLMMVLSASSVEALRSYGGAWVFFRKQAAWVAVGTVALTVTACVDYRRWQRLAGPAVVASAVLLVVVLVPGAGIRVSGSTRWLGWGWLTIQPSELAKLALLVFVADLRPAGPTGCTSRVSPSGRSWPSAAA
jgi:cell division protein FtsW (lipid II flippase)